MKFVELIQNVVRDTKKEASEQSIADIENVENLCADICLQHLNNLSNDVKFELCKEACFLNKEYHADNELDFESGNVFDFIDAICLFETYNEAIKLL